ncbi:MAG TPA: hypothetical protein VM198_14350 [Longimicrobiales bacterium]|nr:hypothetical protein [Longimicrobiales bacterium]
MRRPGTRRPLTAGRGAAVAVGGALALAAALLSPTGVGAQSDARDHNVALAYEGFTRHPDGSYLLWFGYFNRNWDREFDVPVGPDNSIEPVGPDRGQPTHFFPRRNQFVFSVPVPADFGDGEVVWTLTTNGVTERAYGTLRHQYAVDDVVMSANFGAGGQTGFNPRLEGNQAPEVRVEGERTRRARVGEPLTLSAIATDDGKPGRRAMSAALVGQSHFVPNSATGLRLSWYHYRGLPTIELDPPQTKVWEDRRDGGNSPWSAGWQVPPIPPDNRWTVRATFPEPGTYVLRALAHDGGLIDYEDVTIVVTP